MSGAEPSKYPAISVLIVEDNVVNQKVTSAMLKHFGIKTDIAENGQVALDKLRHKKFDIVLMDCQMPVMNGFDTTREIRQFGNAETTKDVPVLAMTANVSPDAMTKCYDSGMNDVIAKPVELDTLSEKLTKWLGTAAGASDSTGSEQNAENSFEVLEAVFAKKTIQELSELMGESFSSVYEAYATSLEEQISALQSAVDGDDAAAAATIAHTLKGSSANVGASEFSDLCKQLMEQARTGNLTGTNELIEVILKQAGKISAVLKKFL